MIVSAPGKIVVWGEYAVLAGAPAAVMAVDRRATVTLTATPVPQWGFSAAGFLAAGVHTSTSALIDAPVCSLVNAVLQHWGEAGYAGATGRGWQYHADSTAFFRQGTKLGLGSSAAVGVATYRALCAITGRTPSLQEAHAAHHGWQGGGSGLDVAASWCGGVIRYENGRAVPLSWPAGLYGSVLWTGHAAATRAHVQSFAAWRAENQTTALDDLCTMSRELFAVPEHSSDEMLARLAGYTEQLRVLDEHAALNIFTQEHARLATIAAHNEVVYKPCGAGGGDIGMAFSDDPERLEQFNTAAHDEGFVPLHTEIAINGVQISD